MRSFILPEAQFETVQATIRQDGDANRIDIAHSQDDRVKGLAGVFSDEVRMRMIVLGGCLSDFPVSESVRESLKGSLDISADGLAESLEFNPVNLSVAEVRGDILKCSLRSSLANGKDGVDAMQGKEHAILCALISLVVKIERARQTLLVEATQEKGSLESWLRSLSEALADVNARILELETPAGKVAAHRPKVSKLGELEEARESKLRIERSIEAAREDLVKKTRSIAVLEEHAPAKKLTEAKQVTWFYALNGYVDEMIAFLRSRNVDIKDLNIRKELDAILSCRVDITKEVHVVEPSIAPSSRRRSAFARHQGLTMVGIFALVAAGTGVGLWRVHQNLQEGGVVAGDTENPGVATDGNGKKMVKAEVQIDGKERKTMQLEQTLDAILSSDPLKVRATLVHDSNGLPRVETEVLPHAQLGQLDGLEYLVAGMDSSGPRPSYEIPGRFPKPPKFVLGELPFTEGFHKRGGSVSLDGFKSLLDHSAPSVRVFYRPGDVRDTLSQSRVFYAVKLEMGPGLGEALGEPPITEDVLKESINKIVLENPIKIYVDVDKMGSFDFTLDQNPLLDKISGASYMNLHMKAPQGEEGFGLYVGGFSKRGGKTVSEKRQHGGVPVSLMAGFDQRVPVLLVRTKFGEFKIPIVPGAVQFTFSTAAANLLQEKMANPYDGRTSPVE